MILMRCLPVPPFSRWGPRWPRLRSTMKKDNFSFLRSGKKCQK
jgi:hypothetical protein